MQRILIVFKWALWTLGAITIVSIAFAIYMATRPVSTVLVLDDKKHIFVSNREVTKVTKEDVENLITEYVNRYYHWDTYNKDKILKEISPLITKGLHKKLEADIKGASGISQTVSNVEIKVAKAGVWVKFYKIVTLKGIPLVSNETLFVELTKGTRTILNPIGVYINKIKTFGGKN